MRTGDDGVHARLAPPRPDVAVPVDLGGQPATLRLRNKPVAHLHLVAVEDMPGIPTAALVPAERSEVRPGAGKTHSVGRRRWCLHRSASAGTTGSESSTSESERGAIGMISPVRSAATAASG